jgi:hypothetical protein
MVLIGERSVVSLVFKPGRAYPRWTREVIGVDAKNKKKDCEKIF